MDVMEIMLFIKLMETLFCTLEKEVVLLGLLIQLPQHRHLALSKTMAN